jgi:hypothetical protein
LTVGAVNRLRTFCILGLMAVVGSLTLGSSAAMAERTHVGEITGFGNPEKLTVDGDGDIWASDTVLGQVTEHSPAGVLLSTQTNPTGFWSTEPYFLRSVGVNNHTNWLYVADGSGVSVFDAAGTFLESWPFDGVLKSLAVDNSGGPTDGRVYVAEYEQGIFAVDEDGDPVNFTASADYIDGNRITGTPEGPINSFWDVTTDTDGNFYATDINTGKVNKYAPSGEHLMTIDVASAAPGATTNIQGVAVDPKTDDILVVDQGAQLIHEFESTGDYYETLAYPFGYASGGIALGAAGDLYIADSVSQVIHHFSPNTVLPRVTYKPVTNGGQTSLTVNATIDLTEGGPVSECKVEYGSTAAYGQTTPCLPAIPPNYATTTDVSANIGSLTTEQLYHFRFVVTGANGVKKAPDRTFQPHAVLGVETKPVTDLGPQSVTLNGSWAGNGEDTEYHFEWGTTTAYGNATPVKDGGSAAGPNNRAEPLTGLPPITTYHYRLVATNDKGTTYGNDVVFKTTPDVPTVDEWTTDVHSDSAILWADVDPGGGQTDYRFEYVDDAAFQGSGFDNALSLPQPEGDAGASLDPVTVKVFVPGLSPGTTYHYRVIASNSFATTTGVGRVLRTFPYEPVLEDPCPNVLERKQTGASLLLDCRAYELVSAPDTGGYNVVSDVIPNQTPYPAFPLASDPSRVLYTMFDGGIPGTGQPTNRGRDPYVATRGSDGWTTEYVGISADNAFAAGPFRSAVTDAGAGLEVFAFSDPDVCSPCFPGGGTGIPIRTPDGQLVQGMVGSIPQAAPVAAGEVRKHLSADGQVLVFGSTTQLEPDAIGGQVSIYARDLDAGVTHLVSKTPGGATMTGPGIAALDVSEDGSRVLIGDRVGTDGQGKGLYHLYMSVSGADETVDLTPTTTGGAHYAGMTGDGSAVFFTTTDALATDSDTSSDLYRADVGSSSATVTRISTGSGAGDTNACTPAGNWNSPSDGPDCDVVPIAGTGGIASGDGTAYFLSPEDLDGNGVPGEPNLYVVAPGGSPTHVVTLETTNPMVTHAVSDSDTVNTADFQTTADGEFSAFGSRLPLEPSVDNNGFAEVYRYAVDGSALNCVSCPPTGVRSAKNAGLAAHGLSIADGGDVFFTSGDPLAPRDLNGLPDAYQWKNEGGGETQLISPGTSPYPSGLHSVSADGKDAYFFTRDKLAPQDESGQTMKIYDARVEGGFLVLPPRQPCAASDECHGPSSVPAPPPAINTQSGTEGQAKPKPRCKKRKVKRVCPGRNKKGSRKGSKRGRAHHG